MNCSHFSWQCFDEAVLQYDGSAASSLGGESSAQLFLKFPHQAKSFIEEHLKLNGFEGNVTSFKPFSSNTALVTVTPATMGASIISELNGSMVKGHHKLIVEYYGEKSKTRSKKMQKTKDSLPVQINSSDSKNSRLYFGSKLPSYTNEQHVREHFKKYSSNITDVELVRDKQTGEFKGYGFISFSNANSAGKAKRAHQSNLLGVSIKVYFENKKMPVKQPETLQTLPNPDDDEDDNLSDCESISSSTSGYDDKIKVIVHTKPKLPSTISNRNFRNHFSDFESSIVNAFVVRDRKTRQSRGFGIVYFSSDKAAEYAVKIKRSSKILGKFTIISLGIEHRKDKTMSSLKLERSFSCSGIISEYSTNTSLQQPLQQPVQHSQPLQQPVQHSQPLQQPVQHSQPPEQPLSPVSQDCFIIENADSTFTETLIRSIIQVPMLSYKRLLPPGNQVRVKCYSANDAAAAVSNLHKKVILGQCISARLISENQPFFSPTDVCRPLFHHSQSTGSLRPDIAQSSMDSHKNICRSVKITHLPHDISKEVLSTHFRCAGEIDGQPVILFGPTSVYAYINYFDPVSAQRAVANLHMSTINDVQITVKISTKTISSSAQDNSITKKLSPQQWNSLMLVHPVTGVTVFKEVVGPFSCNPNVEIVPDYENQSLKFTGKSDAVDSACSYIMNRFNKELHIERYIYKTIIFIHNICITISY